jgi:Zn-dependent protease
MLGGRSFSLGRILGIRIGVNASWFLILFIFIFWLSGSFTDVLDDETAGYLAALGAAVLFFGSIVVHELGHALAARRGGIEVNDVELWFFGGMTKMSRDTESPGEEFFVAVAGPLATLGIAVLGTLAGVVLVGIDDFWNAARLDGAAPADVAQLLLSFVVSMNVLLLVLNLIPAFPLDGGRIARAAVWKLTGDRGRATRISAALGQGLAALMIGFGIYLASRGALIDGIWLAVLGWFIWQWARAAVVQSAFTERLEGVTVADIMDSEPVTVPADLPAGRAFDEYFLRYQGWPWFATVEPDGRFAGLLHREAVQEAVHAGRLDTPVRELAVESRSEGQVRDDAPLEALLSSEPLRRLGALMAVDAEGRLRGVVTTEQVTRALQSRLQPRASQT